MYLNYKDIYYYTILLDRYEHTEIDRHLLVDRKPDRYKINIIYIQK